ncbi:class I SAM-dependent methyltransferase [Dehalococcoidia bacterium]|nr:class I SAM-dependent methyltransferase [Dehalococcoidia bacterium]
MNILKRAAYQIFTLLAQEVCRHEYMAQKFVSLNERAVEYSFALWCINHTSAKTVLDVGTGTTAWPSILRTCGCVVTAIDKIESYWKGFFSFSNRHFYIIKDDITTPQISGNFDCITCISTLEHIPNHQDAIRGMFNLLKPGGFLILTFPYNEQHYCRNVYDLPDAGYGQNAPYVCQVFSRQEIDSWLAENPGRILKQEYFEMFNGEFWTFGSRCKPREVTVTDRHHHTNILIQKL